jgi:hypothetical protein
MKRRAFLASSALGAVALPFVRLAETRAQPRAAPKRLVIVFSPNGTNPEDWVPSRRSETDFELDSPILAPLAHHKDRLLLVEGLAMPCTDESDGAVHPRSTGATLTGRPLAPGGLQAGISIDQHIANSVGSRTRFPSLQLGVRLGGLRTFDTIATTGPGVGLPSLSDPWEVFDLVFGDVVADPAELVELRLRRRSVLDRVRGDLERLQRELGAEERLQLESHLTALREAERGLVDAGPTCVVPELGPPIHRGLMENFPTILRLQTDLLVLALRCDRTRVATFQWGSQVSIGQLPWLGIARPHHPITHDAAADATGALSPLARQCRADITRIDTWFAGEFAYLLDALHAVPEGEGTMLDHTLVLWVNEMSNGWQHSNDDLKWIVAGNLDGSVRTGRYLRLAASSRRPHNDFLTAIANLMHVPTAAFGALEFNTSPLELG